MSRNLHGGIDPEGASLLSDTEGRLSKEVVGATLHGGRHPEGAPLPSDTKSRLDDRDQDIIGTA